MTCYSVLMRRKPNTPRVPKYTIGQDVYFVRDNEVVSQPVIGVAAVFDRDSRVTAKKPPMFEEFRYTFEIRRELTAFGWVSESRIFPTKEDLLATL